MVAFIPRFNMPSNLRVRFISGVLASVALFSTGYFWGAQGLKVLASLVVSVGIFELKKIFLNQEPRRQGFLFLSLLILPFTWILEAFFPTWPTEKILLYEVALLSIFFLSAGVLMGRQTEALSSIFSFDSKAILGLVYVGLLPWFAVHLCDLKQGSVCLISLLSIVFFGDIFAYFFGTLWGRTKVLPSISPKKTIAGAVGGLLGSALAAGVSSIFLNGAPLWAWILTGIIVGFVGQMGDFSESLFKRVAHVKDSGSIMPGHGGILDRIDGVLFAAPVFYVLGLLLN